MSRLYHFFFALVFLFSLPAYSNNYANLTLKKALEIAKSNNYKIIYGDTDSVYISPGYCNYSKLLFQFCFSAQIFWYAFL